MEENRLFGDKFDFDAWVALARSDVGEFERQRQAWLERTIGEHGGDKIRLRGVQCRIDSEIRKANAQFSGLMLDSIFELNDHLNRFISDQSSFVEVRIVKDEAPSDGIALILAFRPIGSAQTGDERNRI